MTSRYAAFRVDPSLDFGNFNLDWHDDLETPTMSNFSPVLSPRAAMSSDSIEEPYGVPDLSPSSSIESLRSAGPITPPQDLLDSQFLADPALTQEDPGFHGKTQESSILQDPRNPPEFDHRYPFERHMANQIRPIPPRTDSLPQVRQVMQSSTWGARNIDSEFIVPPQESRWEDSRTVPPSITPFADFRQGIAFRQEQARLANTPSASSARSSSSLQFLQQDPFYCPIHEPKDRRPKSAGTDIHQFDDKDGGLPMQEAPIEKQIAPSIISNRSTRSVRKGLSRMRRLLTSRRRAGC